VAHGLERLVREAALAAEEPLQLVGDLGDNDTMTWKWESIKYKNSKGYYKNVRNNVVKVIEGAASWVGNFNAESKTITEGAMPPDLNFADLVAELAGK